MYPIIQKPFDETSNPKTSSEPIDKTLNELKELLPEDKQLEKNAIDLVPKVAIDFHKTLPIAKKWSEKALQCRNFLAGLAVKRGPDISGQLS